MSNFQIWKNFARESDVTSVLCSIPGSVGMYEQTKGLLLHLPKTYCSKKGNHSRLINIQHFFTFYSSGIDSFIQYKCNFFQFKIFYHHRGVKYLAQHILLIQFPTGGKNFPYYDQQLRKWVEIFPWVLVLTKLLLAKISECRKMSHYAEKP